MMPLRWPLSELRTIFDMIGEGIFLLAPSSLRFLEVNRAACMLLGCSRRDLLNMCLSDIAPRLGQGNTAKIGELIRGEVEEAKIHIAFRHRDDCEFLVESSLRRLDGSPGGILIMVGRRIRDGGRNPGLPSYRPSGDCLTGVPDRTAMSSRLELLEDRAGCGKYRFALLFVDIDHFKRVNDSLGHAAGDQVLRYVAESLVAGVRPVDMVTRYGGDEFVVLLDNVRSEQEVVRIAGRLSEAMKMTLEQDGHRIAVSASIGISISSPDCRAGDELLRRADQAMYRAKALGRNGSCVVARSTGDATSRADSEPAAAVSERSPLSGPPLASRGSG